MEPINWPPLIQALVKTGLTQPQLAEACKCGQSTISDLLRGVTADPRTSTGLTLLRLCAERGIEVPAALKAAAELWRERQADTPAAQGEAAHAA